MEIAAPDRSEAYSLHPEDDLLAEWPIFVTRLLSVVTS